MAKLKIGKAEIVQDSDKERQITINGVTFFVGLREGRRLMSACHESKKTLQSAAAHLEANGYETKVKKTKEAGLYMLEAREREKKGEEAWSKMDPHWSEKPKEKPPEVLPADEVEFT